MTSAWSEELEGGRHDDRFFHFIWHGGVWLAYGLKDGRVRGVCCPSHSPGRAVRAGAAASHAELPQHELASAA